jgi:hypothetical protein
MLMKTLDKRPSMNTPHKSTLLTHSNEALSNEVNMQRNLQELEMSWLL